MHDIALQPLHDQNGQLLSEAYVNASIDSKFVYLAMSRARVNCTVIMFPLEGTIFDNYHRMRCLLDKLKDPVEVRYH